MIPASDGTTFLIKSSTPLYLLYSTNSSHGSKNIQHSHLTMTRRQVHRPVPPRPILVSPIRIPFRNSSIVPPHKLRNQSRELGIKIKAPEHDIEFGQSAQQHTLEANGVVVLMRFMSLGTIRAGLGEDAVAVDPAVARHGGAGQCATEHHVLVVTGRGIGRDACGEESAGVVGEGPVDAFGCAQLDCVGYYGVVGAVAAACYPVQRGAGRGDEGLMVWEPGVVALWKCGKESGEFGEEACCYGVQSVFAWFRCPEDTAAHVHVVHVVGTASDHGAADVVPDGDSDVEVMRRRCELVHCHTALGPPERIVVKLVDEVRMEMRHSIDLVFKHAAITIRIRPDIVKDYGRVSISRLPVADTANLSIVLFGQEEHIYSSLGYVGKIAILTAKGLLGLLSCHGLLHRLLLTRKTSSVVSIIMHLMSELVFRLV